MNAITSVKVGDQVNYWPSYDTSVPAGTAPVLANVTKVLNQAQGLVSLYLPSPWDQELHTCVVLDEPRGQAASPANVTEVQALLVSSSDPIQPSARLNLELDSTPQLSPLMLYPSTQPVVEQSTPAPAATPASTPSDSTSKPTPDATSTQ